jgi:threonine synthase
VYTCRECGGLLEVEYDLKSMGESIDPASLRSRTAHNMWRYAEFLPIDSDRAVSLGEGFTPLIRAKSISKFIGIRSLYLKLEFNSPTGSFKDRGASMLLSKARDVGARAVAIDSSGNAAASVAAYSAKASLDCYVFTPSYASVAKLVQAGMYNARVIRIKGTRKDVFDVATKASRELGWYYCGFQTNPFASDGMKTIAFEVCEQMEWKAPDRMVFPVGTGSGLVGSWMGLKLLRELGWIERISSLDCIQPEGCAPIARAYELRSQEIEAVEHPKTIAEGLMIGHPLKGKLVLRAMNETSGLAKTVNDDEIIDAAKLLARSEGIFVEPSSAASIAGLRRLAEEGRIDPEEKVVCVLTGTGLKTVQAYSEYVQRSIEISPSIDELKEELAKI